MKKPDAPNREEEILQLDAIRPILESEGIRGRYHHYNSLIVPNLYHNPDGIHGVSHVRRTLLLALLMAFLDKLSDQHIRILAYASVYHDIGRTHDGRDDDHGYDSYQKAAEQRLLHGLPDQEVRMIKELIERHAIDDRAAFSLETVNEDIKNEVRLLLRYFKDADNLDRVRINDLNADYLRTQVARQLPVVAQQLLESGVSKFMGLN